MIFDLFDSPELLDIQRTGFYHFLKQGISQLLAKEFPIKVKNGNYSIELCLNEKNVKLLAPEDNPRDCILKMKTYNCKLYAQVKIICKKSSASVAFAEESPFSSPSSYKSKRGTETKYDEAHSKIIYQSLPEWVVLGQLPMMTKRGHFIINGSPRVIVHQVVRAPGIYFQKLIKKDDQNRARFYGDIIPLKGVWVRLQMTKKGRVEAKFKKGKKVEVEALQKCLQVIENQTVFKSIQKLPLKSFPLRLWASPKAVEKNPITFTFAGGTNGGLLRSRRFVTPKVAGFAQSAAETQNARIPLIYEEASKFLAKKKSRAESKTEHDAFVHTYDKLYRTAQDKELEEWQKKKKNQIFFKGIAFDSSLPLQMEGKHTQFSVKEVKSNKKICTTVGERDSRAGLKYAVDANKLQKQEAFCKTKSGIKRNIDLPFEKNETSTLKEKKDTLNNFISSNAFKRKKCSENLFATFKIQSRYDLGLLGREKINSKFGFASYKSWPFVSNANSCASFTESHQIFDLSCHDKDASCKSSTSKYRSSYKYLSSYSQKSAYKVPSKKFRFVRNACTSPAVTYLSTASKKPTICSCITCGEGRSPQPLDAHTNGGLLRSRREVLHYVHPKVSASLLNNFQEEYNTQLTASDLYSATLWLYKLRKGEESIDDIDHSQNRRVRTSGELLQSSFENGVYRLKNLLSTKLQEWRGDLSSSSFSSIFKSSYKTRYNPKLFFKGFAGYSYIQRSPLDGAAFPSAKKLKAFFFRSQKRKTPFFTAFHRNCFLETHNARSSFIDTNHSCLQNKKEVRKTGNLFLSALDDESTLGKAKKVTHLSFTLCTQGKRYANAGAPNLLTNQKEVLVRKKRGVATKMQAKYKKKRQSNDRSIQLQKYESSYLLSAPKVKELFSTKPITGALREFFGSNPLSQYMDQTNPLAEITHKRRISSLGLGGVSRESAGMAIRGIHPTHYGRICPIETPEGKNAGLVNSLAFYTKVDKNGFLKTPYYRVFKGQVQSALGFSFWRAKEESVTALQIAPSDLQKSSNNILRTRFSTVESVPVRVAEPSLDVFKKENPYKVQAIAISPIQMISVATSLIPFLEHNDANRALMGSNMQRQAVPLMISERAIVGTGLESTVILESGHITESPISGFISHVTAKNVIIDRLLYKKKEVQTVFVKGAPRAGDGYFSSSKYLSPYKYLSPICKERGTCTCKKKNIGFTKNDSLARGTKSKDSTDIRLSSPLSLFPSSSLMKKVTKGIGDKWWASSKPKICCGLRPTQPPTCTLWRTDAKLCFAYKFDTSGAKICKARTSFGRRKVKKDEGLRTSLLVKQSTQSGYLIPFSPKVSPLVGGFAQSAASASRSKAKKKVKTSFLISTNSPFTTFSRSNQNTCMTEKPLVQEFDWVQKGDSLTDCSASDNGELAVGKNVLLAYIPWEGYNFEDAIVISDRLVREHVYTSLHIERYIFQAQDLKEGTEWFTKHLPGVKSSSIQHLEESGLPKIGSFLKEGDIIVGKIRYLNKKPSSPYERLLCDILGEKNFAARNKSLYVPKGVEARVIYHKVISFFDSNTESKVRPLGSAKTVHLFLGEKRVIQVGDKISGRHGNKGVISTILPRQDMPYLPDGTPIDLILNPLGVPSRMNVGQVLECLLGLAASYLNSHFKISAFDERYGVEASKSIVFLKLYQARLMSGQNWLFQLSFPGKTRLVDGRSGECFDQWITVGKAYILKLIHMVSEKIHARSTGPYALITQQPLRGRSNKGGQRLGEMEVWALEGFGAAYTLQELLTKKSDDFFGRKQIVDSILPSPASVIDTLKPSDRIAKNKNVLGHPEIFKVLLCELQALCLDLGVYIVTPESFQRTFLGVVH